MSDVDTMRRSLGKNLKYADAIGAMHVVIVGEKETAQGAVTLKAKLTESLHPRVVATQYGWWQDCRRLQAPGYDPFRPEGANANLLIPAGAGDPVSGCIPHRTQRCRVRKATGAATTTCERRPLAEPVTG